MADSEPNEPEHRWEEDFPVEWERDAYVTRRELTKFLALGSALLAGATALIAAFGRTWRGRAAATEVPIAASSALGPGESLLFRYPSDEDPCIALRGEDGALRAYSQVCTHLSCAVVHQKESGSLFCPCHHGYFSVADGRPTAGPPTRPLAQIRLVERGGSIYATGRED